MTKQLLMYLFSVTKELQEQDLVVSSVLQLVEACAYSEDLCVFNEDIKPLVCYLVAKSGIKLTSHNIDYVDKLCKGFKWLSSALMRENPYHQLIKVPEASQGGYSLRYDSMSRGEFALWDVGFYVKMCPYPRWGIYREPFKYPELVDANRAWMTLTDNEINTMQCSIDAAKGRVLCVGAGLGYYALMVSLKPEVESVTVVEISEDVLKLFTGHILPQFPNKEKVQVVRADFFDIDSADIAKWYDYVFVDIWVGLDNESVRLYLKSKQKLAALRNVRCSYWIEEPLVHELKRGLLFALLDIPVDKDNRFYAEEVVREMLRDVKVETVSEFERAITGNNIVNWVVDSCEIK